MPDKVDRRKVTCVFVVKQIVTTQPLVRLESKLLDFYIKMEIK